MKKCLGIRVSGVWRNWSKLAVEMVDRDRVFLMGEEGNNRGHWQELRKKGERIVKEFKRKHIKIRTTTNKQLR